MLGGVRGVPRCALHSVRAPASHSEFDHSRFAEYDRAFRLKPVYDRRVARSWTDRIGF